MHGGLTLGRFSMFSGERPTLDQFILLSLMLHVLLIVLFGDTAGGGARRGEKLWGALNVTVQSLLPDRGVQLKVDRGAIAPPRIDSIVKTAPVAPASPGVATPKPAAPAAAAEPAPPAPETAAPAPAFELPPLISTDVEKPVTDFVVPKPAVDRAFVPLAPAPPPVPAPRELPATPPPAIAIPEPVAPKIERAPIAPVQRVAPLEPLPREQPVAAPVLAPLPPKVEPEIAKPVVRAAETAVPEPAVPVPAPAAAPATPAAPPAEAKPREIPATPPSAVPAPPAAAQSAPAPRAETAAPTKAGPETTPATAAKAAPAGPPPGSPSASRDLFKPRGDANTAVPGADASTLAPGPATGKAPALDLDAVRRRAREISRDGSGPRTLLPFPMTPPPKPKTTVEQAFDKALKKNDCRDAYADMGLAAVVPLVIDSVRDGGCKW